MSPTPQAVNATSSVPGTPVPGLQYEGQTTPGVEQELFSATVTAGKKWVLWQVFVTCRVEGRFSLLAGSTLVASGRTGPGCPNTWFSWVPGKDVLAGTVLKLKFKSRTGSKQTDLEAFTQATEV